MSISDITEEQLPASQNMTPSMRSETSTPPAPPATSAPAATSNSAAPSATDILQKRHATIEKLLLQSLDEPDPLMASLGATSSDLFELALYVKQSISAAMAQAPNSLEALPNLLPSIESYMSLARMSERIAKIPKKRVEPEG